MNGPGAASMPSRREAVLHCADRRTGRRRAKGRRVRLLRQDAGPEVCRLTRREPVPGESRSSDLLDASPGDGSAPVRVGGWRGCFCPSI
jgi:hypothetical protein